MTLETRDAVLPLVAAIAEALDAAAAGLGDGSATGQYEALQRVATGLSAALAEHETWVMDGALDDDDDLAELEYARWHAEQWRVR